MLSASCSVQIIQAGTGRLPTGEETSVLQIIQHSDNFEYHNLQSVRPSDVQFESLVVLLDANKNTLEVPDRCFSVAVVVLQCCSASQTSAFLLLLHGNYHPAFWARHCCILYAEPRSPTSHWYSVFMVVSELHAELARSHTPGWSHQPCQTLEWCDFTRRCCRPLQRRGTQLIKKWLHDSLAASHVFFSSFHFVTFKNRSE